MGIMGEPARAIGRRFVDAALVTAIERDAGAAGEDEFLHAVLQAAGDHVLSPEGVRFVK